MQTTRTLGFLTLAIALMPGLVAPAKAGIITESGLTCGGNLTVDVTSGVTSFARGQIGPPGALVNGDVYSNIGSPRNFSLLAQNLNAVFGDRVMTTGTGTLDQVAFSIANGSASTGTLMSTTVTIQLNDGGTSAPLGTVSRALTFPGGIPPGTFDLVTLVGLTPAAIFLNTTDIQVTQQLVAPQFSDPLIYLGIASLDPVTIGSSGPTMYISDISGGYPPGYYQLGRIPNNIQNNPAYRIGTADVVPTKATTWGLIKILYR